jgi:hypothetical protein
MRQNIKTASKNIFNPFYGLNIDIAFGGKRRKRKSLGGSKSRKSHSSYKSRKSGKRSSKKMKSKRGKMSVKRR